MKLSRSKIDLFIQCKRCFYLDQKLKVKRPSMPAFTLNSAVDHLLKKEFDIHREKKEAHPLMTKYGISAIPFAHEELEKWRHNFTGIQYKHEATGFLIYGAIDDIWKDDQGELHIVDYKATSKNEKPTLDGHWQQAYKRQMEIYQWLFKQNGYKVSDVGYFVYVNGRKDEKAFDGKLEFDVDVITYKGDSSWIPEVLIEIANCLKEDILPEAEDNCEHCAYRKNASLVIKNLYGKNDRPKEELTGEKKDKPRSTKNKDPKHKGEDQDHDNITNTLF